MQISHLGAKDCITGSCHLVETRPGAADSVNILVDCGAARELRLLILESTYGDGLHPRRKGRVEALRKVLQKALADKGIVYIPAFSLGRTQELLYELDRIGSKFPLPLREGRLRPIRQSAYC